MARGEDTRSLIARSKRAWERLNKWDALLEEAYSYAMPHRNVFSGRGESGEGQLKMERVVDSTAMIATARAAGRIQRDLMPPFERSFVLEPGPAWPKETRDEYAKKLEMVTDLVHTVLSHSNFATASHESYLDLLSGRCNMMILRGTKEAPINCVAIPRAYVAIEEGAFGAIGAIFRRPKLRVDLLEAEYPGIKLPANFPKQEAGKEAPTVSLHEATYQNGKGKWITKLLWEGDSTQGNAEIWKQEHRRTSPWVVARYMKVAGEVDGRGPLLMALPDMRTLNKGEEMLLMQAALAMSGVYTTTDDDVVNLDTVTIGPGVFLKVERNLGAAQGPSIMPLQTGRDFDLTQLVFEPLRANVKKILIDNDLPPETGAVRSPTEYIARQKEFFQDSGAAYGRLQTEWVIPIVQRVLDILADPAIGLIQAITVDQLLTKVQVTSPLASAQKLNDAKAVVDWLGMLGQIGGPELGMAMVALSAKVEDIGDYLGQRLGVPASLRRDDDSRKALQQLFGQMIAKLQGAGAPAAGAAPAAPAAPVAA